MRRVTAQAAAAAALLALCCLGLLWTPSEPRLSAPTFAAPGIAPRSALVGVRQAAAPARALEPAARSRAPPQAGGASFCRAALGLAALCVAAGVRSAVARNVQRTNPPRGMKLYKWMEPYYEPNMGYRISGAPGFPGSPRKWAEPVKWVKRFKNRIHVRRRVEGTIARPRVAVFRSHQHMHVNVLDDTQGNGITLLCATTKQRPICEEIRKVQGVEKGKERTWSYEAAEILGKAVARQCLEKDITQVVFDRGGFKYDGRVKALAEAARSGGLQF